VDTVDIIEAKRRLFELVDRAAAGEDVVVSRNGTSLVRITRVVARRHIRFGLLKGKFTVPNDFDAPLPTDLLRHFET
jgi:prevent-host-death family protein